MHVHVDDIIAGMQLESDVRLKAGSFLITRKELQDGYLTAEVIEAVRKFGSQIAPEKNKVQIVPNDFAFRHLKEVLSDDIHSVVTAIRSEDNSYPNFIKDADIERKILTVIEKLISNQDLIKQLYTIKIAEDGNFSKQFHEHIIRVTILALAIGLKLKFSIVSLLNVGIAAVFHDLGLLKVEAYPLLAKIDDYTPRELEEFVKEHQRLGVEVFENSDFKLLPYTKKEIARIIEFHHRPDFNDPKGKMGQILYFAELVDEMLSPLAHKVRYNFAPKDIKILGERFARRQGLVNILLALAKLSKESGEGREIIECLLDLFSMQELLVEGYEEKLREIVEASIYKAAVPYPSTSGNSLPRTIYCNNSVKEDFSCPNLGQANIEIYLGGGKVKTFKKCSALTNKLHELNKAGKEETEHEKEDKSEVAKKPDQNDS